MTSWELKQGDALDVLRGMESESVQCVVTSPPYFGLRDYGAEGQIGLEKTPAEYVAALVEVFREVRRVLRKDGTCWVNLGDSYVGAMSQHRNGGSAGHTSVISKKTMSGIPTNGRIERNRASLDAGLKPKDLMMIPARVALALQDDGWYLRSEITWCKRAPMPESVRDRPTSATEKIYLLTRSERYYYDQDAIREAAQESTIERYKNGWAGNEQRDYVSGPQNHMSRYLGSDKARDDIERGRNAWNYWLLSPEAFPAAHFATFPTEIPRRAILAGTSERGCCPSCMAPWRRVVEPTGHVNKREPAHAPNNYPTKTDSTGWGPTTRATDEWQPSCTCPPHTPIPCTILDPFAGSGTTLMVALRLGRHALGIELKPEYVEMATRRIRDDCPMFNTPIEASV